MWLRYRQRAQITPLALFAMLILTGAVALVVDAGVFFVTQRQLQTAVDAAALAAVWYEPVCNYGPPDCKPAAPTLPTAPAGWSCSVNPPADCVANAILQENVGFSGALCRQLAPLPTGHMQPITTPNGPMNSYIMTVDCDAPFWFARIFPSIPATMHLRVFARASVGYPNASNTNVVPVPAVPGAQLASQLLT